MAKRRVRLSFSGELYSKPIIYTMSQQFNLVINIHQADLAEDRGWIVLGLEGKEEDIEAGIAWAISKGVRVETVGEG